MQKIARQREAFECGGGPHIPSSIDGRTSGEWLSHFKDLIAYQMVVGHRLLRERYLDICGRTRHNFDGNGGRYRLPRVGRR